VVGVVGTVLAYFPAQPAAHTRGAVMAEPIITVQKLSKYYRLYAHDFDRVREIFSGKSHCQQHFALQDINFTVSPGEVVGVVGKNGAGKSTLLKLLANTMQPSTGTLHIKGRVAALLELGASFHPEMSGHDNIYLNCSIGGLSKKATDAVYADIVEFSGIREFIHRPVKTYSSGMFVRLAFSIATHIDPDILIIDEALSVGDGVFARRSFDRIMAFKKAGKTIFFCSHSLYQVEAMCDRVIWLDQGKIKSVGLPAKVITEYDEFLRMESSQHESLETIQHTTTEAPAAQHKGEIPRMVKFHPGKNVALPSVAVVFTGGDGRILTSVGSLNDGHHLQVDAQGVGIAELVFPEFPLLKGRYNIDVYLLCEQGLHVYESIIQAAELNVEQIGLALGIVNLPHSWKQ
jgi:lipopolysaccharide transport system ATP-binding protein